MQKLIVITFALLILVSCSQQKDQAIIEQRIADIENTLIEFESPAAMLQRADALQTYSMTLIERMEHYNTPALSIAVINNNQIVVDIFLIPAQVAEFIQINVNVTKSGVSFEELIG